MTHPRAATKALYNHISPTTLKTPPSQRFRSLLSSTINQPTCFTLLYKYNLTSYTINPFLLQVYIDISLLLIKQLEYSCYARES
jgi:hypothetical protein